jgi:hypothetical protein
MRLAIRAAVRRELVDTADRLVHEYDDLPPGSVLRCYSRAVTGARRAGVQEPALAEVAERHTRSILARRYGLAEPCLS